MNEWTGKLGVRGLLAALIFAAGLTTGWMLWRPKAPKTETVAPSQRQVDGSLVLERKPDAAAKPAQIIPKGAKVDRVGFALLSPKSSATDAPAIPGSGAPLRFDWSLVDLPDRSKRMIFSSPDGTIVGGQDIPVAAAKPEKQLKWAAGIDYTATTWGNIKSVVVDRDIGFLRLSGHVGVETISPPGGGMLRGQAWGVSARVRW